MDVANYQFEHPRGLIYGWFSPRGLAVLHLPHADKAAKRLPLLHSWRNDQRVRLLDAALERYFAGQMEDFASVPTDLSATSSFQQQVYDAARTVTWGHTSTYRGLCERLSLDMSHARAVGHALGANPLAIIVPCHRFLSANGKLTGFAAGLAWKEDLLRLEGLLL